MEIEIKARVHDFTPIKRRLRALGARYVGRKHQIDTYYSLYRQPLRKKIGRVLRVRHDQLNGTSRLELHEPRNRFAADEYEVGVTDYRTLLIILKKMKARREFVVDKKREVFRRGRFEIVLDTVKHLGKFVEVELEGKNTAANKQRVTDFMLMFGVARRDFVLGIHYNGMMLQKLGKKYAYF